MHFGQLLKKERLLICLNIIAPMRTVDLLTDEELCAEIGARCRALRLGRNLGQAELAAMAGSSLSSIRRLETLGQATLSLLVRVLRALQATRHFDDFLLQAQTSIADLERAAAAGRRRRAGPTRQRRPL